MADIRIKDLATTASSTAADDFLAVDGITNGTRKLSAATPSFATSVTVPGVAGPTATNLTLAGGSTGASLVLGQGASGGVTLASVGSGPMTFTLTGAKATFGGTASNNSLRVSRITTNPSYIEIGATTDIPLLDFSAASGAGLRFVYNNTTELARLTNTGNLLIGTTTDGGQKLQVAGTASFASAVTVNGTGTFGSSFGKVTVSQWSDATNYGAITLNGNTTVTGSLGIGGGASGDSTLYLNAPTGGKIESRINGTAALTIASTGAATFAGAVAINNTVATAVSVASTHKVTMVIGGVTYYLLASNV